MNRVRLKSANAVAQMARLNHCPPLIGRFAASVRVAGVSYFWVAS